MSLQSDAQQLLAILQNAIEALSCFSRPHGASYATGMAGRLAPLVSDFEQAIHAHSREAASAALDDIKPLMLEVSGAATKGELDIFTDDTLDRYYELATIFQESKYAGHAL